MRICVKKWGNSAAVRIPTNLMEELQLNLDDIVDISVESGHMIIKPCVRKEYDLDSLLNSITNEQLHNEIDFGEACGREAW